MDATTRERQPLTRRQQEVAKLMCNGMTNKEIARELDASPGTIKNHVAAILERLQVSRRAQAVHILLQQFQQKETTDRDKGRLKNK